MKVAHTIVKTCKDSIQAAETAMYHNNLKFSLKDKNTWLFVFKDGSKLKCTPQEFNAK